MTSRSSGFTLIELLVVVAIIGILAAVGIMAYTGYVSSAKIKSTENIMQQIGLAQTEYYSDYAVYYHPSGANCTPSKSTSIKVEDDLLDPKVKGSRGIITEDLGFEICVEKDGSGYNIKAINSVSGCEITVDSNQAISRKNC